MPYNVNFTDIDNKSPITVFDNTSSTDTSLTFPGRNVTGYGQIIAENFLHLLENFASSTQPVNPVEGQLWYDSATGTLNIWDNVAWKAASGIQKGPSEPSVETSKVGELWIDTTNQQLRIFTGSRWILVGPSESSIGGLRYGPAVEKIVDSDNIDRFVQIFYIKDVPVIIFSKDSFIPKIAIPGYTIIKAGLNVNVPVGTTNVAEFEGGLTPKLYGTALTADALNVSGTEVAAGKFLRSDVINTTEFNFNIRSNSGLTIGTDGTFTLSTSTTAAQIYNSASGSSIDLQTNRNGIPNTVLRVIDNKIGINVPAPDYELQVGGSVGLSGNLIITNTTESTNLNNGSVRTAGGMAITKNLIIGTGLDVTGTTQLNLTIPRLTDTYDLGSGTRRWNTVNARTVKADTLQGNLAGNIDGNAQTATSLKTATSFSMTGDVVAPSIQFDGQVGGTTKVFNTQLTVNIISDKPEPSPLNVSKSYDYVLTYRTPVGTEQSGLLKQSRDTFVGDLGVPIGAILPYAGPGTIPPGKTLVAAPYGYLFCDGSEVEIEKYRDLYNVIGTTYNGTTPLAGVGTFRLPDLRGRFPLGKDNMKNEELIFNGAGVPVNSGGGNIDRVPDTKADILGEGAGQSSVSLTLSNLPEHEHSLQNAGVQYSVVRVDTAVNPPATTGAGPTAPGQVQYLNTSGGIKKPDSSFQLGTAVGIMNPYLTINYIIRSGPSRYEKTA